MLSASDIIDRAAISPVQIKIFIICFLVMVADGFDAQAIGYVAPALVQNMKFDKALLGPVFTLGIGGMACGALLFGPVGDRVGRRPMLTVSTGLFGLLTLLKSEVTTYEMLLALQFLAGLAIGGAMPIAIAVLTEYAPKRLQATVTTVGLCGFLVGSSAGGILAAVLIPKYGWQSVFVIGGVAPIILSGLILALLPESIQFLVEERKDSRRAWQILRLIDPKLCPLENDVALASPSTKKETSSVTALFRERRALPTILLWLSMFMVLILTYFMLSWLPTIIRDSGLSDEQAILATATMPISAVVGTLVIGWIMDRLPAAPTISIAFIIYAACTAAVGYAMGSFAALLVVLIGAGIGSAGQMAANALAGRYYPTMIRSTGVGWMLGVGRTGSVLGPLLGSFMLSQKWQTTSIFLFLAVPAVVAATAIYLFWLLTRRVT